MKILIYFCLILSCRQLAYTQEKHGNIRGDSSAVAEAIAMVETMGGVEIWAQLKSIHFVHEWYPCYRVDSYIENEILDLTGPRSWVERKSEINLAIRAYSIEGKYWSYNNGNFAYGNENVFKSSLERAPFNFYRLVRAVAIGDSSYEIRFGEGDIPQTRRLEFFGADRVMHGWIILNANKEPIVKATTEYRYTLGPLKRFGNLWIPSWGVYDNGLTRYEMISVSGSNQLPDSSLFVPPQKFINKTKP
ncbi:hypothetical protein JNM05_06630 [bacterium]|nr:hypothetical protein [bacterium]